MSEAYSVNAILEHVECCGEEARDHIKRSKWDDAETVHVFRRILPSYRLRCDPPCRTCDALKGTLYIDTVIRRVRGSSELKQRNSGIEVADQRATSVSLLLGVKVVHLQSGVSRT